jgi:hypothetical protein
MQQSESRRRPDQPPFAQRRGSEQERHGSDGDERTGVVDQVECGYPRGRERERGRHHAHAPCDPNQPGDDSMAAALPGCGNVAHAGKLIGVKVVCGTQWA